MKVCSVCQRCYEDAASSCAREHHAALISLRPGSRIIAANYQLNYLLERDAASQTYQATHVNLNKFFVIKLISAKSIGNSPQQAYKHLDNEAQIAASIDHPNITSICEYGVFETGEFYLVTESIGAQTLRRYLDKTNSISVAMAVSIARQVAEGLDTAHRAGLIHRAINPTNLLFTPGYSSGGSIKIQNFDFGGFKQQSLVGDVDRSASEIDALRYLSPEQCIDQAVDGRSDVYSLGVVLYEMLSGQLLFEAPTAEAIIDKQISEQPPSLNNLQPNIKALLAHSLMRSLDKSVTTRPKASALARYLRHVEYIATQSKAFSTEQTILLQSPTFESNEPTINSDDSFAPTLNTSDSFVDQNQLDSASTQNISETAMPNSVVSPAIKREDTDVFTETDTDFHAEPILVEKKENGAVPFINEPVLVEQKNADVAVPVAAESFGTLSGIIKNKQSEAPTLYYYSLPAHNVQNPLLTKRSLSISAWVLALLTSAIFGVVVINKQGERTLSDQTTAIASPSPDNSSSLSANEESVSIVDNIAATPVVEKPSVLPADQTELAKIRKSPVTTLKSDDKTQTRVEASSTGTTVKLPKDRFESGNVSTVTVEPANQIRMQAASNDLSSQAELNSSLTKWITATNERDIDGQMSYYAPKINSYYRTKNALHNTVRAEKKRVFGSAAVINMQASKPEIDLSGDGRNAKMRFRKKYVINDGQQYRRGEVVQELHWVKTGRDWKIVSERDVRVINR